MCPCCGLSSECPQYSLLCNVIELSELGIGYVFFFKIFTFSILIYTMLSSIGIYKSILNFSSGHCISQEAILSNSTYSAQGGSCEYWRRGHPPCVLNFITIFSLANFGLSRTDLLEQLLLLITWIVMVVGLALMRGWMLSTSKAVDFTADSPGDFSIMVSGLSKNLTSQDIKIIFTLAKHYAVEEVSIAYKLADCNRIIKRALTLRKQIRQAQSTEVRGKKGNALSVLSQNNNGAEVARNPQDKVSEINFYMPPRPNSNSPAERFQFGAESPFVTNAIEQFGSPINSPSKGELIKQFSMSRSPELQHKVGELKLLSSEVHSGPNRSLRTLSRK